MYTMVASLPLLSAVAHYTNKNVFSDRRNPPYDKSASLRRDGKLFHSPEPTAAEALSPRPYILA